MFNRTGEFTATPGTDLLDIVEELFVVHAAWTFLVERDGYRIWILEAPYRTESNTSHWHMAVAFKVVGDTLEIRAAEMLYSYSEFYVVYNPCPDPTLTATPTNTGAYDSEDFTNAHVVSVEGETAATYWITVTSHGLTILTSNQGNVYYTGMYENFTPSGFDFAEAYQYCAMLGHVGPTGTSISCSRNWEAREVSTANAFALETVPLIPEHEGSKFLLRRTTSQTPVGFVPDMRQFLDPEGSVGDTFVAGRHTNESYPLLIRNYDYLVADIDNHMAIQWTFDIDKFAMAAVNVWDGARPGRFDIFDVLRGDYWVPLGATSPSSGFGPDADAVYPELFVKPGTFSDWGWGVKIFTRTRLTTSYSFITGPGLEIMFRGQTKKMVDGPAIRFERYDATPILEMFATPNAMQDGIIHTFRYHNTAGTQFTAPTFETDFYNPSNVFNIAITADDEMKIWLNGVLKSTTSFTLPHWSIERIFFAPDVLDADTGQFDIEGVVLDNFIVKYGVFTDDQRSELAKVI